LRTSHLKKIFSQVRFIISRSVLGLPENRGHHVSTNRTHRSLEWTAVAVAADSRPGMLAEELGPLARIGTGLNHVPNLGGLAVLLTVAFRPSILDP